MGVNLLPIGGELGRRSSCAGVIEIIWFVHRSTPAGSSGVAVTVDDPLIHDDGLIIFLLPGQMSSERQPVLHRG